MLVYCRECGQKMSDKATTCPHCGFAYEADTTVADEKPGFIRACIGGHSGRVCRRDYWLFLVAEIVLFFIVGALIGVVGIAQELDDSSVEAAAATATVGLTLVLFPFWMFANIGRLHDIGFNGWWFLLFFIPILNFVWWLYVAFMPSDMKENKWGKKPV